MALAVFAFSFSMAFCSSLLQGLALIVFFFGVSVGKIGVNIDTKIGGFRCQKMTSPDIVFGQFLFDFG